MVRLIPSSRAVGFELLLLRVYSDRVALGIGKPSEGRATGKGHWPDQLFSTQGHGFRQRRRHVIDHDVEDRVVVRLVAERVDMSTDVIAGTNARRIRLWLHLPLEQLRVEISRLRAIATSNLEIADLISHCGFPRSF